MHSRFAAIAINYFAMFVVLLGYPIAVARALAAGAFFPAVLMHLEVLFLFGMYYRWRVRAWPEAERVSGLSFVPQALVMPITYALLTPLALFTLDSTSWETRGHGQLPAAGGDGDVGSAERAPLPIETPIDRAA